MIPPVLIMVRGPWRFLGGLVPVPLVLLWPFLLVAFVVAVALLPFIRIKHTTASQRLLMPWAAFRLLGALRGLTVDVQAKDGTVVQVRCW